MAYELATERMREIIYSGDATYDCKLYFNNTLIPAEQLASIKISSPIIDTTPETGKMFHLGTFISQQIIIKFKNLDGLDLTSNPNIYLEIGVDVDGEFVYVPIGYFLIDELGENYQKTCEITCLDYAIKFKPNLDIKQFFNEDGYIVASDLFEAICRYFGVEHGTYPAVNNDKRIYFHDDSLSGKNYISYLAELFGGNAKIGRDGKCYIVPLKDNTKTPIEIDALGSKSFEVGDVYEISRVCYDNGKLKFQAGGNVISVDVLPETDIDISSYYYLTTDLKYYTYVNEEWREATELKNTLYIRQDNLLITKQEEIDNIYNAVAGFKIHNITCENRGDLTLDAWDIIKYTTDEGEFYTLNENEMTYNGVCMSKVKTNIPAGKKNETTNIIRSSIDAAVRRVQTIVNEIDGSMSTITESVKKIDDKAENNKKEINNNHQEIVNQLKDYAKDSDLDTLKESVKTLQDDTKFAIDVTKEIQANGVTKLDTKTGFTFDESGLNIEKTGAKVKSKLNEAGLDIRDATGATNESLMYVGYDNETGETIVRTKNLTVNKYLVIGNYSRMEDFDVDGVAATGMFWIGG